MKQESESESDLFTGDFVPSPQKATPPSSSFRQLFCEFEMVAEWEAFECEVLRDITDSHFAFQITLERVEVRNHMSSSLSFFYAFHGPSLFLFFFC